MFNRGIIILMSCKHSNPSNDDDKGAQYPELYKVIDTVCPVADRPSIGSVGGIGMKFLSKYIGLAKGSCSVRNQKNF